MSAPALTVARRAALDALPSSAPLGPLLRDREVRAGRDGEPSVRYRLSRYDARHLQPGMDGAAHALDDAGARTVIRCFTSERASWAPGRVVLYSSQQMGTARMGTSPETSACDPEGSLRGAPDVIVCEGATFPSASAVNPMVTISAVAHMNSSAPAARL